MIKEFDNGLTKAETERLVILMEECGEAIQAASKILRHGWESTYDSGRTNREQLEIEIADITLMVDLLIGAKDISVPNLEDRTIEKLLRINSYLHYNKYENFLYDH